MVKFEMQLGLNECDNQTYHADKKFYSSSDLKTLLKSPQEFYETKILGQKKQDSDGEHFSDGSYAHTLILEPHLASVEYAIFPGLRRSGADYEAFKAAHPDKKIITRATDARVQNWVRHYRANKVAVDLIQGGHAEYTLAQEFRSLPFKCRADYINIDKAYIVDVKTSAFPVDIDSVRATNERWGYPLSAALYSALFEQYYGKKFQFYWLFLCKGEPDCQVYRMADHTRIAGMREVQKAIDIYKQCQATGLWKLPPEQEKPVQVDVMEV